MKTFRHHMFLHSRLVRFHSAAAEVAEDRFDYSFFCPVFEPQVTGGLRGEVFW